MANEITISISGRCVNGKYKDTFQPGSLTFDQATLGGHSPVVTVTTAQEALTFGDIGTKGWICGRNLDATNYIIWGPTTGSTGVMHPCGRIEAGEPFAFRFEPTIPGFKWHSNTGTVKVQLHLWQD